MAVNLSRLQPLDARVVWTHEAYDFTPWLLENADALADVLGIELELTAAEHPVGPFALDLVGEDLTNGCVLMVENQLTATDHSHLGQLITYAAGTEARTVVWMATSFREEHRQAVDFLNALAGENARFFAVEIGVVRIGESLPAPLFKMVAQPNDWHAQVATAAKATTQAASAKGQVYAAFWTRFLERVHTERPGWTTARNGRAKPWTNMKSPFKGSGVVYSSDFPSGKVRCSLYIDKGDGATNLALFEAIRSHQREVEEAFGAALSWEDLPNRRACRIAAYADGDVVNVDEHDAYISWLMETGTRLRHALEPFAALAPGPAPDLQGVP